MSGRACEFRDPRDGLLYLLVGKLFAQEAERDFRLKFAEFSGLGRKSEAGQLSYNIFIFNYLWNFSISGLWKKSAKVIIFLVNPLAFLDQASEAGDTKPAPPDTGIPILRRPGFGSVMAVTDRVCDRIGPG